MCDATENKMENTIMQQNIGGGAFSANADKK